MKIRKRLVQTAFFAAILLAIAPVLHGQSELPRDLSLVRANASKVKQTGSSIVTFLKQYTKYMKKRDLDGMMECYSKQIEASPNSTWTRELQSQRDGVSVFAWIVEDTDRATSDAIRQHYRRVLSRYASIDQASLKLAFMGEVAAGDPVEIHANLEFQGTTIAGDRSTSMAAFRMTVVPDRRDGEIDSWRISSQQLLRGQSVEGRVKAFSDVAAESGLDFRAHHNPALETDQWRPERFAAIRYASAGVSAADFDNDGWCDIFFADGKSPRLYRNTGGGRFTDVTREYGLSDSLTDCNVGIFADLDNDGDRELLACGLTGNNRLFRNDGSRFVDVTESAGLPNDPWVSTAAIADFDNDGLLDIYLGRYLDARRNLPQLLFYTRNGEGNKLLRNQGGLQFEDVTRTAGVRDGGLTLGLGWCDIDRDGDQDLYLANDFGRNTLFRNDGDGTFTDTTRQSGTIDIRPGMSVSFADVDNDLDFDLYISNIHSGTRWFGHRSVLVDYLFNGEHTLRDRVLQLELYGHIGNDWDSFGVHTTRGNSLFINDGTGAFRDQSTESDTTPFGWYWTSSFWDFDNDGWQDIYAVNGWITGETIDDL